MSYQARMRMPLLMVTGRIGAWGKTKRTGLLNRSSGTTGSKSWPSAPRPCSQITAATGGEPVSISTASIGTIQGDEATVHGDFPYAGGDGGVRAILSHAAGARAGRLPAGRRHRHHGAAARAEA